MTRQTLRYIVLVTALFIPSVAAAQITSSLLASVDPPPHYVIGTDDVLSVVFWRDKDMSADVVVRPDGKISLPLVNELQAGGLSPAQLRDAIEAVAKRYVEEPSVTVVVKQINSRKLFITGQVEKPGSYSMSGPTTVLQLISMAGGLREFADGHRILIMRTGKGGKPSGFVFNYRQVAEGKNLAQNIELQPGDTVVVP
jgi:polysaccharide export outer membrane protein